MKSEMCESDVLILLMSMSYILILPKIEIGYVQPSHDLTSVSWSSVYDKEGRLRSVWLGVEHKLEVRSIHVVGPYRLLFAKT